MKVTRHADKRMRKRVGVNRSAVERMARKAMTVGATREDFSGPFRRYLDGMYYAYDGEADNIRVYGGRIWIFAQSTLITVMNVPKKFINRVKGMVKYDISAS